MIKDRSRPLSQPGGPVSEVSREVILGAEKSTFEWVIAISLQKLHWVSMKFQYIFNTFPMRFPMLGFNEVERLVRLNLPSITCFQIIMDRKSMT